MENDDMQIELIDQIDRLEEIRPFWKKLISRSTLKDIYCLPEFFFPWWQVFGHGKEIYFICFWNGKELSGLIPLYRVKKVGVKILYLAGESRIDFIFQEGYEKRILSIFSDWLYRQRDWDLLVLRAFSLFTDNALYLKQIFNKNKILFYKDKKSFFINLYDFKDYDDYLKTTLSKHRLRNLIRVSTRIREKENVETNIYKTVTPELIDEIENLDSKMSLRGLGDDSFFSDSRNTEFLKLLVSEETFKKNTLLFSYRVDGYIVAFLLVFTLENKAYFYQMSYHKDFNKYGVGIQALTMGIKYSFENSFSECDFMLGDQEYKKKFGQSVRKTTRLIVYQNGFLSFLIYFYHKKIKPLRAKFKNNQYLKKIIPKELRKKIDI
ncbi:MAG: GNAT family N-acetyltransferase [Proteobacteria bacterium]|nr:GNAT family N-acetyltransferase [Pseudomonadota bacterium]